ncbi:MAG TPA: AmmeMemoRadiSam system protein B [Thermopetrobacter sp.]|nr:AmmeMemoRadiSam system protein B [Thermopetrobacter sp.]
MPGIRPPAVAGMFYPADPRELEAYVRGILADAVREVPELGDVRAVVAPHAGYVYSAPVAAHAYAALARAAGGEVRRIVLMGPAHTVPLRGIAAPAWDGFATPLGVVPVDVAARQAIAVLPQVTVDDLPHAREHSLEVQLPFLQVLFPDVPVLPLVVGEATPEEVAEVMEALDDGHTLFVISSDLSHYEPYDSARAHDAHTARLVEALDHAHLSPTDACGARPLAGLLLEARRHGWRPHLLDLRNSGDTAGDPSRVVGYGAWAFAA